MIRTKISFALCMGLVAWGNAFFSPGPSVIVSGRQTRTSTSNTILMGRGDTRTTKGKRMRHTYGICRPRKPDRKPVDVGESEQPRQKNTSTSRRWEVIEYDEAELYPDGNKPDEIARIRSWLSAGQTNIVDTDTQEAAKTEADDGTVKKAPRPRGKKRSASGGRGKNDDYALSMRRLRLEEDDATIDDFFEDNVSYAGKADDYDAAQEQIAADVIPDTNSSQDAPVPAEMQS